ncbi:MAG: DUF4215 domain-containing protein [Myxococcota bacterium]
MSRFGTTLLVMGAIVLLALTPTAAAQQAVLTDSTWGHATADGTIGAGEYPVFSTGINSGFADVLGATSKLSFDSGFTDEAFVVGLQSSGPLADVAVIYLDCWSGGYSDTTSFADAADAHRRAISGRGTSGETSELVFAPGFEADLAIAFNSSFAGLWLLDDGGNDSLLFLEDLGLAPLNAPNAGAWEMATDLDAMGIAVGDSCDYVATYINAANAFRSDEFHGVAQATVPAGNPGSGATVTLGVGDFNTFATALPPLAPGTIAFTGYNADGDDDLAFVVLTDLVDETIFFTDDEVSAGGALTSGEGRIRWDSGTVSAGTVVTLGGLSGTPTASVGTVTAASGVLNLAAGGDSLLAYQGDDADSPVGYLAGLESASGAAGDPADAGLTPGLSFITASTDDDDGGAYTGPRDTQVTFARYLALVNDPANWSLESSDGTLLVPFDATNFTLGAVCGDGIVTGGEDCESATAHVDTSVGGSGNLGAGFISLTSLAQTLTLTAETTFARVEFAGVPSPAACEGMLVEIYPVAPDGSPDTGATALASGTANGLPATQGALWAAAEISATLPAGQYAVVLSPPAGLTCQLRGSGTSTYAGGSYWRLPNGASAFVQNAGFDLYVALVGGDATATCDADCTTAECGDGTLNTAAGETCDDAGDSALCNAECTQSLCGDGVTNALTEECDEGEGAVVGTHGGADFDGATSEALVYAQTFTLGADASIGTLDVLVRADSAGACDGAVLSIAPSTGGQPDSAATAVFSGTASGLPLLAGEVVLRLAAAFDLPAGDYAFFADLTSVAGGCALKLASDGVYSEGAAWSNSVSDGTVFTTAFGANVDFAMRLSPGGGGAGSALCTSSCQAVACGDGVTDTDAGEICDGGPALLDFTGLAAADHTIAKPTSPEFVAQTFTLSAATTLVGVELLASGGPGACTGASILLAGTDANGLPDLAAIQAVGVIAGTSPSADDPEWLAGDLDATLAAGTWAMVVDAFAAGGDCTLHGSFADPYADGQAFEYKLTQSTAFELIAPGTLDMSWRLVAAGAAETADCDTDCTAAECGDGVINATTPEICDDGNDDPADGCSSTCDAIEVGWRCPTVGAACECADGFSGDGCATFSQVVTTESDLVADDGLCSLREAITAMNTGVASGVTSGECAGGAAGGTITLPSGTFALGIAGLDEDANATGDLDVLVAMAIVGAGRDTTYIDGAGLDRVLHLNAGPVQLEGLSVVNGAPGDDDGGCVYNDSGTGLSVVDARLEGCSAGDSSGGAIATGSGVLTLTRVEFLHNEADSGGAVDSSSGSSAELYATDCLFSGNNASSEGTAVSLSSSGTDGVARFVGCTFTDNTGPEVVYTRGHATLMRNCTVVGNSAGPDDALIGMGNTGMGVLTLEHTTITGNTAKSVFRQHGSSDEDVELIGSVVAGNGGAGCTDLSDTFSFGGNVLHSSCDKGHAGDVVSDAPLMGALSDNGGLTATAAPGAGSPALGLASCLDVSGAGISGDQRGEARPVSGCTAGAYEVVCGDGDLAGDEGCDDDGTGVGDGCGETCEPEFDFVCAGEPSVCVANVCGDGVVAGDEDCDTAGQSATCEANCEVPRCGDGTLNTLANEECDAGEPDPACDVDCTLAECGDGTLNTEAGEVCDDGGETATCGADCNPVICGDGVTNSLVEDCDGGSSAVLDLSDGGNLSGGAAGGLVRAQSFTLDAETHVGSIDLLVEAPTAGECTGMPWRLAALPADGVPSVDVDYLLDTTLGDAPAAPGRSYVRVKTDLTLAAGTYFVAFDMTGMPDCGLKASTNDPYAGGQAWTTSNSGDPTEFHTVFSSTGDWAIRFNSTAGAAFTADCNDDCSAAECGDGVTNGAAGEACDDGDGDDVNGCGNDCQPSVGFGCDGANPSVCVSTCGDGVAASDEACDTGGNSDTCDEDCTVPECGDGVWNASASEACDEGGQTATCEADCSVPDCGDGVHNALAGEACDEGGQTATCEADCAVPDCGDGVHNGLAGEACDDGDDDDDNGCANGCVASVGFVCDAAGVCASSCGDGVKASDEACDDGDGEDDDGCSAACVPEDGYSCTGTAPSVCVTTCGDGAVAGAEACDDGDQNNANACTNGCLPGPGYTCDAAGVCTSSCGDGVKASNEGCDDGDNDDDDGCSAGCVVEAGYSCAGGAPSVCLAGCGDGIVAGSEECDDDDNDGGDGCAGDCTVEAGYKCDGASPSVCAVACGDGVVDDGEACEPAVDGAAACDDDCTVAECGDGVLNEAADETCDDGGESDVCDGDCSAVECGDGVVNAAAGEGCDDGNDDAGDGCGATCAPEDGFDCVGAGIGSCVSTCGDGVVASDEGCDDGDLEAGDGCGLGCEVEDGWGCAGSAPSVCETECGDGVKTDDEECDDGDGDDANGCSNACVVAFGFDCVGAAPSVCESTCGDGEKAAGEGCDDGDVDGGDGCSAACAVEVGFSCVGTAPSVCEAGCGDGKVVGLEGCDDGDNDGGDGCSADCEPEAGFDCVGTAPSVCASTCGDSELASDEACDDGGTDDGDGCSAACAVEHGFDCGSGQPSVCVSTCGDSKVASDEGCDDGGTDDGDGCSAVCAPETGFDCGSAEPSACASTCGDGTVASDEGCDDGGTDDGDGCSAACEFEATGLYVTELHLGTLVDVGVVGQWIELRNGTAVSMDLTTLDLGLASQNGAPFLLGEGCQETGAGSATVAAGEYVVIALDSESAAAGLVADVVCDGSFGLEPGGDVLTVSARGAVLDTVDFTGFACQIANRLVSQGSRSLELADAVDQDADSNDAVGAWCLASPDASFDTAGVAFGSPGSGATGGADGACGEATCDAVDDDCDGEIDEALADGDEDGLCDAIDCEPTLASCTDNCATDVDKDGVPDCSDGCIDADADGWGSPGGAAVATCDEADGKPVTDCNDADTKVNPGAVELCTGGVDEDCDGLTDCAQLSCVADAACGDGDFDDDGVSNALEALCGSDRADKDVTPSADDLADPDSDGLPNCVDDDDDGDTLTDAQEEALGTDPRKADSDGDGAQDDEEVLCGTDPNDAASLPQDLDSSGVCDGAEVDTDGDGVIDALENLCGTDPNDATKTPAADSLGDADADGVLDCVNDTKKGGGCNAGGEGAPSGLPLLLAGLALLALARRRTRAAQR